MRDRFRASCHPREMWLTWLARADLLCSLTTVDTSSTMDIAHRNSKGQPCRATGSGIAKPQTLLDREAIFFDQVLPDRAVRRGPGASVDGSLSSVMTFDLVV